MSRSPWKYPCRFLRTRGGQSVPCRSTFLVIALLLLSVCGAAGAPENAPSAPSLTDVPPGMTLRWINFFYMTVPSDWKPMVERDGVGFFTGAHPDAMDDPSLADLPMVALAVTRQKPPKGGDYRAFFADMEKMAARDNTKNFSSKEQETTIGGRPAMFYSFSAEVDVKGKSRKMEGNIVVGKEPDQEGRHTIVMLAGSSASVEKHRNVITTILASAKEGPAPIEKAASFPFGATQEAFRHSEGPFAAPDGTVAVLDRFGKRIRFFDASGTLLDEWGTKGKGEDGTFAWPTVIAFAPDGSVLVADEGYSVDANIQHFSRTGEFLGKIKADPKTLGKQGIYKPVFLAVAESGKIVAMGSTAISKGKPRVLVFSPEGKLLSSWDLDPVSRMALLPGEKLVLAMPQPENDRAEKFAVYDFGGKLLKEWPFWGSDLPATPGDEKVYFRPDHLAADGGGRIYAYDDSDDGIWMYGPDGRFLQIVPAGKTFGIVEGMAVLPNGDVIVKDRPGGYGPGEPSIHRMKNAFPAVVRAVPEQPVRETPQVQQPSDVPSPKEETPPAVSQTGPDDKGLENELARLKEALRLREEAASLEKEGNRAAAAAKYRESLAFHDDLAVKAYAEGLERMAAASAPGASSAAQKETPKETSPLEEVTGRDARQKAEALWNRAGVLQQAKKYEEALVLYRKGLELTPDTTVSDHVVRLEAFMPKAKARAEEIWRQAGQLQNGKKYGEALKKYREGLGIYYNKVVEDHVRKLEGFIARQKK